eukprot:244888-Rhodomonas_salina.5
MPAAGWPTLGPVKPEPPLSGSKLTQGIQATNWLTSMLMLAAQSLMTFFGTGPPPLWNNMPGMIPSSALLVGIRQCKSMLSRSGVCWFKSGWLPPMTAQALNL